MLLRTPLILVCLAALAASSVVQENIKLKNGTVVNGRATAYDPKNEVLSFRTADGQDARARV